ncbi:hypothetical protein LCGC14_2202120, partial [marine sediment metagenome]
RLHRCGVERVAYLICGGGVGQSHLKFPDALLVGLGEMVGMM